jgi:hypothetical protein
MAAGSEIVLTAIALPNQGLEYRFLINGPGTGNVMRDFPQRIPVPTPAVYVYLGTTLLTQSAPCELRCWA